jgi:aldehyde dehydrogenase (NAD+)
VVLELGGKSPAFVLEDCGDALQLAADRLIWAKMIKAGQICISPDYLLVEERIYDKFMGCLLNACKRMCPGKSKDLDQIVTLQHWDRLLNLLETSGGTRIFEGPRSRDDRYFGLTLIAEPLLESDLMREEVFGPILPIIKVRDYKEGIGMVNRGPKPLMLYVFGTNTGRTDEIKKSTRSGNFMTNDCILSFLGKGYKYLRILSLIYAACSGGVAVWRCWVKWNWIVPRETLFPDLFAC